MKIIKEPDIRKLRLKGKVSGQDGKKIETVRPVKEVKPGPDTGERQAVGLENIARILSVLMQSAQNDRSAEAILELARTMDGRMMINYPEPVKGWTFVVVRDSKGYIDKITAEAI